MSYHWIMVDGHAPVRDTVFEVVVVMWTDCEHQSRNWYESWFHMRYLSSKIFDNGKKIPTNCAVLVDFA
jgi:hypothetical protein